MGLRAQLRRGTVPSLRRSARVNHFSPPSGDDFPDGRAHGPLQRRLRARRGGLGEERVVLARKRVAELALDPQAGARRPARARPRGRTRAGGRSARTRRAWPAARPERLSSSGTSTSTRARDARGLAQQRQRVRDVLEHVREHRQVVRAVLGGHVRAVEGLEPPGARDAARAGDLDRRRARARSRRSAPAARPATARPAARPRRSRSRPRVAGAGRHSATACAAFVRAPSSRQRPSFRLSSRSASE